MPSEFQQSKIDHRFELLDADGDGYITAADFDEIVAKVCDAFDFADGSPQYEKLQLIHLSLWDGLSEGVGGGGAQRLDREQFTAVYVQNFIETEGGYDQSMGLLPETVFEVVDEDDDGVLHIDELARWISAYGVREDDARRALTALDREGEGVLSLDELRQALKEFYIGDDPAAPGNDLFGPLPGTAALPMRKR